MSDDDDDLIREMMDAWFGRRFDTMSEAYRNDMRRVLVAVREHDASAPTRVPVQIATDTDFDTILALSNDHRIFVARWSGEGFVWTGALPPLPQTEGECTSYQSRVHEWMLACFGDDITANGDERVFRFIEEALELAQARGCLAEDAHKLVDYVFGRPVGDAAQEVGGVMVTLAALCTAAGINLDASAEAELSRVRTLVEKIRNKHRSKPKDVRTPLPGGSDMTERQGLFPPDVNDTMTRHWLQSPTGAKYYTGWGGENWWVDGAKLPPWAALEAGWTYLGPAATYEQARSDQADARRFRWVASLDHGGTREIRLSGVKRNGDAWSHGISWNRTSDHADIRAAIDAAMKEQDDA